MTADTDRFHRLRWWGLAAISVAVALIIMDATIVSVAIPSMVTSLDLSEAGVADNPGGPSLRKSVLDYMASNRFAPATALTLDTLDDWMSKRYVAPGTVITPQVTNDIADPGQVRRRQ